MGLNGQDGRLIQVGSALELLNADPSTGRTATPAGNWEIERVNMGLLCLLSGAGYTLVIEPSALSPQGEILALDGDLAAISIAVTVRADTLLILAVQDADDPTGARRTITLDREERLSREALIARERLKGSLKDIRLSEGCDSYPISGALWGSESIISISGINTLWMQSSLAT
jgi:acetylglutamate kinase